MNNLSIKKYVQVKGAKVHNLKNLSVDIPKNKLVVVTGVSGSGKSSLAFDTLYAEGQRRYVESLSSYARQFLGRMEKPEVESIKGISPSIAIQQKVSSRNPRSTVGTSTEIYDYMKLLFARVGKTFSPISENEVKRDTIEDVVDYVKSLNEGIKGLVLSKIPFEKGDSLRDKIDTIKNQGYNRIKLDEEIIRLDQLEETNFKGVKDIFIVVDRFVTGNAQENVSRITDSIEIAFKENNDCYIELMDKNNPSRRYFSGRFERDGMEFIIPNIHLFSFNNPLGACPKCEGYGQVIGIDEGLVIPNENLSVYEDAIVCWKGDKMQEWKEQLIMNASKFDFPIHRPIHSLTEQERDLLWTGNRYFEGIDAFFKFIESQSYKIQYRVMLSRYRGKTKCGECKGRRLRKEADYIKINEKSISDLVDISIEKCLLFFDGIKLTDHEEKIASRILIEIKNRLQYLLDVGLGYLTLNRLSSTLSGGESQRINLSTSLGSSLVGSMYILDEPSIGLHSRDTIKLIQVLKKLRDIGNTVLVVEHDEDIMKEADEIIDIGPLAGVHGGEVVFQGNHDDIKTNKTGLTSKYLTGEEEIPVPKSRRKWKDFIQFNDCRENNLKGFDVKVPLNTMTIVTGVSGSGKSSLVKKIIYPAIKKQLGEVAEKTGKFKNFEGDISRVEAIEFIDQNPIGKSSRSNPVTYVKAYDEIRTLYSKQQLSVISGFKPKHFSFNVEGGRCEHCQGEGEITVEMQFMADVKLTCEVCNGKRFKDEVLEVKYKSKNIFDILNLTIEEAIEFFGQEDSSLNAKIIEKISPLFEVGLGYLKLGQSSSTLSGGEAQRIKLGSFLSKGASSKKTLFIFDEPTTGLHFHDIKKLLYAFNALLDKGHSLLIVEHNPDVIKNADWIIDIGPEGGEKGGEVVFEGIPEDIINCKESYTGFYLKEKL